MIKYQVGNYTFSHDLKRFARAVGKEGNYTLGLCKVELLEAGNSAFNPDPVSLDKNSDIEKLSPHALSGINGRFGIQTSEERQLCSEEDKSNWLKPVDIPLPNGVASIDALIDADLHYNKQPSNQETRDFAFNRLLLDANKPVASVETVTAMIVNSAQIRANALHDQRIDKLAHTEEISTKQAQVIYNCHLDGEIIYRDDGWHTKDAKFFTPPTEDELNQLVTKGMLNFSNNAYTVTEQAKQTLVNHQL